MLCPCCARPSYLAVSQDWLSEQWELMAEQPWFRGDMNRKDAKKELVGILGFALQEFDRL